MQAEQATVLPFEIAQWVNEEWVSGRLLDNGISAAELHLIDPSKPFGDIGSSLISWAAKSPHRPGLEVTREVIRFFLEERHCDPNVPDNYGRTPLVQFVKAHYWWMDNLEHGLGVIRMLLKHGADANALFTPDYPGEVKADQWRLAHHCMYSHILDMSRAVPEPVVELLSKHWDVSLKDSENRGIAEYEAIPKVAWERKNVNNAIEIQRQLNEGVNVWATAKHGILSARVQVLRPCNPKQELRYMRFVVRAEDGGEDDFPAALIQPLA